VARLVEKEKKKMTSPSWNAARKSYRFDRPSIAVMCLLGAAAFAPSEAFAVLPIPVGCTPGTGNNVVVICSGGTVFNQGPLAGDGYGDGTQNSLALTVQSGTSVIGTTTGIDVNNNNVINNFGTVNGSGNFYGVSGGAALTVNNSGTIGRFDIPNFIFDTAGINAFDTGLSVTNNIGGTIQGSVGIQGIGVGTVVNSGLITGLTTFGGGKGIDFALGNNPGVLTVTNNATGVITGDAFGINANSAVVYNYGTISGPGFGATGLNATTLVLTNYASGLVTGDSFGVSGSNPSNLTITNFGTITATGFVGVGVQGTVVNIVNAGTISSGLVGQAISMISGSVVNNAGGVISGDFTAIQASGNTSIFNAGTITTNNGPAITFGGSGNSLTLAPGFTISGNVLGAGADTLQLGGTGTGSFDASLLGPAAQYQGFGTFNKIDSSIWTLTGTSTFAGAINVNGGTLVVNGDVSSAGIMKVNPGGTLSGTGIVPFTLVDNGATLAPGPVGTAIGMLTIKDRVLFCTCSIYAVKVSGTGNDFAQIMAGGLGGGEAFLGGAVRVSSPTSSYRFNSPYTILTTQGGLSGTTFGSLATPSGIGGTLSYTANDVLLTLSSQLGQVAGLNTNQRAVATALDAAFNAVGQTGALGAIFAGNIKQNLTQASGEVATGSQQTTFDAMSLFMGLLTDPFIAGRGDGVTSSTGASPFAEENDSANAYAANGKARTKSEREAYAAIYRKAPLAQTYDPRWSVWAAGFGGSQSTDGNATLGSNNTTSRVFGMAAGADYIFSPRTIAGFALAGGGTNFSVANGGSGRSDLFQAGAFVRHTVGPAYISAALAYGWQDVTTDRTVTIAGVDQLRARFNANAFSGRVEGGYRFVTPWIGGVGLTPYAAGQFTTFDLPAYAEQVLSGANTFALAYGSKSVTASRSELGIRTDKSFPMQNAILTLRGRFAWAHDFNPDRNIAATFQTLPGASFVVNGAVQARDAALTTASAEIKWLSGFSLAATFEGEFSDVTRSYAGKGVVRYQW
jgi:uncharacterized protein with beta-barrel porin domain